MENREQTREQLVEELEQLRHRVAELEEQQEKSNAADLMLRSIVRAVPDVIYRLDASGKIVFINEAVRNYGYEPDELIGTSIFELIHPEDRAKAAYRINERRTGERSTRLLELRLLTPSKKAVSFELMTADDDGEPTLLVNAEGIYSSGTPRAGEFLYTQGVARDITERKWASRVLEKSKEELSRRVAERTAELEVANRNLQREERRQRALNRMREEMWRMNGGKDIEKVIAALRDCLVMLGVPVQGFSIHVVKEDSEPLDVKCWSSDGPSGEWDFEQVDPKAASDILQMWRAGKPVYRRDLKEEDPYREFGPLCDCYGHEVRSVLDVPYSHGTVGINNEVSTAFSAADVQAALDLVQVLSEGFLRREDFEALQKSEERYRQFVEELPVGLSRNTLDGRILYQNAYVEKMLGYTPEEQARLEVGDIYLNPADRNDLLARLNEKGEHTYEYRLRRKDGEMVWVRGTTRLISDEVGGEILQGFVEDITEQKRLEEERHRLEEQLRHSQKMEAVGQLTAGVAHHFNNMLQGIVGNLHLAMFDAQPEIMPFLDAAQDASERAADMIRQLMVFTRQGMPPARQTVDLVAVVQDTVGMCRKTFDRRIEIAARMPAEILVEGDPGQLRQVVMNLMLNARDAVARASGRSPVIGIHVDEVVLGKGVNGPPLGPCVRLRIEDNGVGMDEQTGRRVFEPFFTTKQVGQGTGLGLATSYAIVHQHGGAIECRSELGTGTRMQVYLPAVVRRDEGEGMEEGQRLGGKEGVRDA